MPVTTFFRRPYYKHHAAASLLETQRSPFRSSGHRRPYLNHTSSVHRVGISSRSCHSTGFLPELEALYNGNRQFRERIVVTNPGLLETLVEEGQRPQFLFLDCSDSRVCEQTVFSANPGTMFTIANIANQHHENDPSATAALSFAVNDLGVRHVVVMGHYGCGGIAAALMPPAGSTFVVDPVQRWIQPIRELYRTSMRKEIIQHREDGNHKNNGEVNAIPHVRDPAFRALVEENVKMNVQRIAKSDVITTRYAALAALQNGNSSTKPLPVDVFVHGWIYDMETGEVLDLGISIAPPGTEVPKIPFRRPFVE